MGTIFTSVTGVVSGRYAALLREEQTACRERHAVAVEEDSQAAVRVTGSLHQLIVIDTIFLERGAAEPEPAVVRVDEARLGESVRLFANVTEISDNQVKHFGFDKNRGLDTKSKHYELENPSKFYCDTCSFKTKRQSHMEKHFKMHEDNPTVFCCPMQDCSFKCIRNGDLTRHNLVTHLEQSEAFACSKCTYKTSKKKCFTKHLKYSHKNKEVKNMLYECSKCPYKTMKILFFTRHMKKHGVMVDSKTAQTKMTVNLKCELCEYEAKRVEHITRHVETVHSDERKYLCQTCGIGFKRSDALKLHNVVHTSYGDQHYPEPDLNQNPEHKNTALIEHSFGQGNQKNFKCNSCSKGFSTLALLQKHSQAHHSNPDAYVCEVCSKTFNTQFNLKRHSRAHGGELLEAGDCRGYPSPRTMDQLETDGQLDNGEMLPQSGNIVAGGNQAKVGHVGFIVEKSEATFLKPTERWRMRP